MWKLLLIGLVPLWVVTVHAERVEIPKAKIAFELPANEFWQVISASQYPSSAESMCFPRLRHGSTTISVSLWEYPYKSLDAHIRGYFERMNRYASGSFTRELGRSDFTTNSGVTGVRLRVETGRDDGTKWELLRYIFKNRSGMVVCISANGNADQIDKVVSGMELFAPNR